MKRSLSPAYPITMCVGMSRHLVIRVRWERLWKRMRGGTETEASFSYTFPDNAAVYTRLLLYRSVIQTCLKVLQGVTRSLLSR